MNLLLQVKDKKEILLISESNENIKMDGKEIYKYAVTETVKSIKNLLKISNTDINEIKYIVTTSVKYKNNEFNSK